MKHFIHLLTGIVAMCCTCLTTTAQPGSENILVKEHQIIIPSLTDLIDSALNHNALVKFRLLEINAKNSNLKTKQHDWTRNLGVQADSRYGTFDNFSSNNNGLSTSIFNTTSRQLNYGIGVYMKIPIMDILDRKNQVKRANVELEQAKNMAEAQQDELRQLVIRQYQEVLLKQKLLNLQSIALGNARVNTDMVEKEFRNGLIQVSEYVRISDIALRVEVDYEKAKTDFITAKMILENIVGFTFRNTAPNN